MSEERIVWGVWVSEGEYENWTTGIDEMFTTQELADAYADRLRTQNIARSSYEVRVHAETVLDEIPKGDT